MPFLEVQTIIEDMKNINGICTSEDLKILYAISNEDDQIYIIKDDPKQIPIN